MKRRKGRAALVASVVVLALACLLALVGCKEAPVPVGLSVDATGANSFKAGDLFMVDGVKATLNMSDGSDSAVNPSFLKYRYANGMALEAGETRLEKAGTNLVTADYNGLKTTYPVQVEAGEATVMGISIASMPDKTSYAGSENTLDLRGLGVTAYMSDGTSRQVKWTEENANGIATNYANGDTIEADAEVDVTYGGKTAKFKVTYTKARTLTGIEVVSEPKVTNYSDLTGYAFSATGLVIQAIYSDGNRDLVRWPNSDMMLWVGEEPLDEDTAVDGGMTVTVSYKGASDEFEVYYKAPKRLTSLAIVDKYLYEKTYIVSQDHEAGYATPTFDLKALAYYDDGTVVNLQNTAADPKVLEFGGDTVDLTTADTYDVTVSYTDPGDSGNTKIDSYEVTVAPRKEDPEDHLQKVTLLDRAQYAKAYVVGEYEHPQSVKMLAQYSDGTTSVVTSSTFSPSADTFNGSAGTPTVTVSYTDKGKTQNDTFTVTIVDLVDAKSIAVSTLSDMPTTFAKDGTLDYEGLVLDIRYDDDMMVTKTVSEIKKLTDNDLAVTVAGPNSATLTAENTFPVAGDWTVTVSYTPGSKRPVGISSRALTAPLTCFYKVKVTEEATLDLIAVSKIPDKTNYAKDDTFKADGLIIMAQYSDGSQKFISYPDENMTFKTAGDTTLTPGSSVVNKNETVTVTYQDKTAAYAITYQAPKQVTKVSIVDKALYAVTLTKGDSYTKRTAANTELTVYYDDGTSEVKVAIEVDDGVKNDVADTYTVTASYTDPNYPTDTPKSDSYTVRVVEVATVTSLAIQSAPDKTSYAGTDKTLDLSGLSVTAYMSDGTSRLVIWTGSTGDHGITTSPANGAAITEGTDVTVTYGEKNAKFKATYTDARTLTGIEVLTKPDVTNYTNGGTFSAEGLSLQASYSDGTQNIVRWTSGAGMTFKTASGTTLTPGTSVVTKGCDVTVTYAGKTTTFQIAYQALKKVTGISIVNKSLYEVTLTKGVTYAKPSTVSVEISYDDGTKEVRSLVTSGTVDTSSTGNKQVTVTYTDPNYSGNTKSDSYTVKVVEAATVRSIAIASMPDKISYTGTDKTLDLSGLSVTAYMSDGTSRLVIWTGSTGDHGITTSPANGAAITEGTDVTVTYGEKNAKFKATYTDARTLTGIEVLTKPDVTNYTNGGTFSAEGLSLQASYSDGTQNIVRWTSGAGMTFKAASGTTMTPGTSVVTKGCDVTVTYGGKSSTYTITYQAPKKVKAIEIVNKVLYEVTLTRGDAYTKPSTVTLKVTYDDGTSDVQDTTDVGDVDTSSVGPKDVTVRYTDPNYPEENTASVRYKVTIVNPVVPSVAVGVASVGLNDTKSAYVWKVKLSSGVAGATYTYRYGTDYATAEIVEQPVTATGSGVDVEIPCDDGTDMKVWLTEVTATGYSDWKSTEVFTELPVIERKVKMSVDRSENTDWKVTLSAPVAGSPIQYRYSTDTANRWRDYDGTAVSVFAAGIDASVEQITIEARLGAGIGGETTSQSFERVTAAAVKLSYGVMGPEEGNGYPTIEATAPEGYVLEVYFDGESETRYRNADKSNVAKLAVTDNTARRMVVEVVGECSGSRMMQTGIKLTSGDSGTWTKGTGWKVGGTGPMGGKIVNEVDGKYWEVVVPQDMAEMRPLSRIQLEPSKVYSLADLDALCREKPEDMLHSHVWYMVNQVELATGVLNLREGQELLGWGPKDALDSRSIIYSLTGVNILDTKNPVVIHLGSSLMQVTEDGSRIITNWWQSDEGGSEGLQGIEHIVEARTYYPSHLDYGEMVRIYCAYRPF